MSAKKILITFLKIVVPIGAGLYIVWALYANMSVEDQNNMWQSFKDANYWWVFLSILAAVLSHMIRAYRWKFLLEPLGHTPRFWNSYHAVIIGYFVNLLVTRMGEISRCAALAKYEKVPFNKAVGTVISERVADFLILITITILTISLQFDVLRTHSLFTEIGNWWSNLDGTSVLLLLVGLGFGALLVGFIARKLGFYALIKNFLLGLMEGMKTILSMKKKWAFIGHTALIWILYTIMLWFGFQSVEQTTDVSVGGMFACFVFGSFAILFVPGGIGVYPAFIAITLLLYGVEEGYGAAFGWIVWASQTAMFIVLGSISLILMPIYNRDAKV